MRGRDRRPAASLLLRRTALILAVLAVAWAAGFGWFLGRILIPTDPPLPADGIVVLTGGAGRIKEAFHLLLSDAAPRLLISGVAPGTRLSDLARLASIPPERLVGRVVLGRSAATTDGNAREAAAWAHAHGLASLIVVTSFYHMPRALADFRATLPNVRLEPVSVPPPGPPPVWRPDLWRVVAGEYTHWLAAKAGLGFMIALWERGEPA
ncbi:MAG TPA: YdcF family protein [Acetobacteraceae bacterium]|nr:YdcF family protein [Acetobacteraceae bacterium]